MDILHTFVAGPYNVALTIALIVGFALAIRAGTRDGIGAGRESLPWIVLLVAAATGGLIGSKFISFDLQIPDFGEKSNLGGIVAGVATVVLVSRWLRLGVLRSLDLIAVPTLVGMAIGRVGCFLANCCIGTHTDAPWGVHLDGDEQARHPVQLYEAVADLLLVAALTKWVPVGRPGLRIGGAVLSYAAIRFATEFVRADRTMVAGLNPVQWSLLAVAAGVGLWFLRRSRVDTRVAMRVAAQRLHQHTHAFITDVATYLAQPVIAARVVSVILGVIAIGASAMFTPLERAIIGSAGVFLATVSVLRRASSAPSRALLLPVGALLFMQAPVDSTPPKRELLAGGGLWSGAYTVEVGEEILSDGCGGTTTTKTMARRRSTPGWLSFGFRQRLASGKRVTVEGKILSGSDRLKELSPGPVTAPVAKTTTILAGGATLAIENHANYLGVSMLGGTISKDGRETRGVVGSITGRTGADRGFFLEGNVTNPAWYATTGDLSYVGFGRVLTRQGARVTLGVGSGAYIGLFVPVRSVSVDMAMRMPASTRRLGEIDPNIVVGVKKAFTIR